MDLCRVKEIGAARDMSDPLGCVIEHHGEVVGCAHIAPSKHDVSDLFDQFGAADVMRSPMNFADFLELDVLGRAGHIQS